MKMTKAIKAHFDNIENARIFFDELKEEKQSTYDDRSEKWQESGAGEEWQEGIDNLETLVDNLQETTDSFESIYEVAD